MNKKLTPLKNRVFKYLEYKKISKVFFYKETGIHPSNFKGKGGVSELGGEKIIIILTIFSDLNPSWLLLGEGEMLRNELDQESTKTTKEKDLNTKESNLDEIISEKISEILQSHLANVVKDVDKLRRNVILTRLDIDDIKQEMNYYVKK